MDANEHEARLHLVNNIAETLLSFVLESGENVNPEEMLDSLRLTSASLLEELSCEVVEFLNDKIVVSFKLFN